MARPRARSGSIEHSVDGHIMAGVMVLLALMLIFSTVVFQSWQDVLRRDNEAEMIFRAEEIARAILRYKKDQGGKPLTKLEMLLEPGSKTQYLIRRLYTDPLVKDGKWGLLYEGPGGQVIDPNAVATFTKEQLEALGVDERARAWKNIDQKKQNPPAGSQQFQPITDPSQGSEAAGGRQFAGLPIAGVRTLSTDKPFRVYKGQSEYAQWKFTWQELQKPKLPGQPGTPGAGGRPGGAGSGSSGRLGSSGGLGGSRSGSRDGPGGGRSPDRD